MKKISQSSLNLNANTTLKNITESTNVQSSSNQGTTTNEIKNTTREKKSNKRNNKFSNRIGNFIRGTFGSSSQNGQNTSVNKIEMKLHPKSPLYSTDDKLYWKYESLMTAETVMSKIKMNEENSLGKKGVNLNASIDVQSTVKLDQTSQLYVEYLAGGELVFYRKILKNKRDYIQGFVIYGNQLIGDIVKDSFTGRKYESKVSLKLGLNNDVVDNFDAPVASLRKKKVRQKFYKSRSKENILLYQAKIISPLNSYSLVFAANKIPLGSTTGLVDLIVVIFVIKLLVASLVIYRAGVKQLSLADERANFVSAVSHELRTPLTSIRMYAEMLRSNIVPSKEKRLSYLKFILSESERLSRLISNVLQFSKISKGNLEFYPRKIKAGDLLIEIEEKVKSIVSEAGFVLETNGDSEFSNKQINVDIDWVTQIFINLVDNAVKFSKQADKLQVDIGIRAAKAGRIEFYTRDYGPGIPKEQLEKIFQLFYRPGIELTRTSPGSGIGLALVKELSERMGAKITPVNCSPGAEFRLEFPC